MDWARLNEYLSTVSPGFIIWIIGVTVTLILLLVFALVWRKVVSGRVQGQSMAAGMHFGDVERMRKEGLINEEEYRSIKKKVAQRTLAETYQQREQDRTTAILLQAAVDPDAVRQFLPAADTAGGDAEDTAPPAVARRPQPTANRPPAADTPPTPAMNMPRVVQEKKRSAEPAPAGAPAKSELDVLFEKGAISREEYERLKGFFKG